MASNGARSPQVPYFDLGSTADMAGTVRRVLCVAEKPSVAKAIANILGSGRHVTSRAGVDKYCRNFDFLYRLPTHGDVNMTMTSVRGHLTDSYFPESFKSWRSAPPMRLFSAPVYTRISSDAAAICRNLEAEARNAQMLMIWTDCDREGEHIGSEIVEAVRKVNRSIIVRRARFSTLIPNQIRAAARDAAELDWLAAAAVEARIELDLRVGAAFTRLQTLGLQDEASVAPALLSGDGKSRVISYGPCQFPTLGFVVERYERVERFVPEPFWALIVHHRPAALPRTSKDIAFAWDRGHLFDHSVALTLHNMCTQANQATVQSIISKPTRKWKPYPLTTVDLQKACSRLFGMSPRNALAVAEKLYNQGLLSYPRTETDQFDPNFDFSSLIDKQKSDGQWGAYAAALGQGAFERPRNGRKNDEAHPPIHPTMHANSLSGEEKKVYDYVARRFLASCSKDAIGQNTTVRINVAGEGFKASALVVLQRNYLDVFLYDKWESSASFPAGAYEQDMRFNPSSIEMKEGETQRPRYLTEADLVGLMDTHGIGTDATIADHIAKVIEREYVFKRQEGRGAPVLVPSTLGIGLVEGYNRIDLEKSLSKPYLRAETELRMSRIVAGEREKQETIDESLREYKAMYTQVKEKFHMLVASVESYLNQVVDEPEPDDTLPRQRQQPPPRGDGAASSDSDSDDGPPQGGGATRGSARGRPRGGGARAGRVSPVRRIPTARPRSGDDDRIGGLKRPRRGEGASGASTEPLCECQLPTVKRIVNKEGPNKGRHFYVCNRDRDDASRCDYFAWADDGVGGGRPVASAPTRRTSTGGTRSNPALAATPRCECGLEAVERKVSKETANKGRTFWTCSKANEKLRCRFFAWTDEPINTGPQRRGGATTRDGAGRGGGQGRGGDTCFKCGREGHWASSCPDN